MLTGRTYQEVNESHQAEQALIDSYLAADASRHDEVRAEDAIALVWVLGYEERRYADAQHWAKSADAILRQLGGRELQQAWLLNNLGGLYELRGEREEALRAHQQGLALKEQALGPDHPDIGISEGNLSVVLTGLGRNQEALEHVDRSIQILENGLGAGHPDMATELNNRGEILNALGRSRDARASFEKARIIWERELGLENRTLAYALTGIGVSYLAEGDPGIAVVPLERAFKIREAQETESVAARRDAFCPGAGPLGIGARSRPCARPRPGGARELRQGGGQDEARRGRHLAAGARRQLSSVAG